MESADSRGQHALAESICCPGQEARERTGAPQKCQIRKGPRGDSKAWLGMTKVMTASHDIPYIQHNIQGKNKIRYKHKHFS